MIYKATVELYNCFDDPREVARTAAIFQLNAEYNARHLTQLYNFNLYPLLIVTWRFKLIRGRFSTEIVSICEADVRIYSHERLVKSFMVRINP